MLSAEYVAKSNVNERRLGSDRPDNCQGRRPHLYAERVQSEVVPNHENQPSDSPHDRENEIELPHSIELVVNENIFVAGNETKLEIAFANSHFNFLKKKL